MKKAAIVIFIIQHFLNPESHGQPSIGEYKFDRKNEQPKAKVYKDNTTGLVFFKADYDLDLDGHPQAYHPQNKGLLHNDNGKNSQGEMSPNVVLYVNKKPYIQKVSDPAPGYYLSLTTLHLTSYAATDARRYVHPDNVTYFVLPGNKFTGQGIRVGDIGLIYNQITQKYAFAIYADSGPGDIIGEGSTLLAKKLDIPARISSKTGRIIGGLDTGDILYIVFPGSGKGPGGYPTLKDSDVSELGKKAVAPFETEEKLIQRVLEFYKQK